MLVAIILLSGVVACDRSQASTDGEDSALTIVGLEEDLRIGAVDGPEEYLLSSVSAIEEGPEGQIYVLDGSAYTVRMFDSQGKALGTVGRRGEGPGEFMNPTVFTVSGDTIAVLDSRLTPVIGRARFHLFHSDGTLIRSAEFGRERWTPTAVTATPNGWFVQSEFNARVADDTPMITPTVQGPIFDSLAVQPLDLAQDSEVHPSISIAAREVYQVGAMGWHRTPLLAPRSRMIMSPSGVVHVARGDEFRIETYSIATGDQLGVVEREVPRISVTDDDFRAQVEAELESINPEGSESAGRIAMLENDYPRLPRSTHRPITGRVLVSPGGRLLVERLDLDPNPFASGDPASWDLVDANGDVVGAVVTPTNMLPLRLTDSYLYARVRDELDVSYAVRFRLVLVD